MATTENEARFREYYLLAERLIEVTEKDVMAEVARILAIHVAHYQSRHGKVPMEETLHFLHVETLTDDELGIAADAMEYLTAVLGVASGLADDGAVT